MQILLTNDDGIHAPGLGALAAALRSWAEVTIVAPVVEQSGVGHSVTYLHPLLAHREYRQGEFFGWKVEGSPADCVKLGVLEFCPKKPDLVISGINHGANVGINVLYSGTVAAAIEGAFFSVTSIALSQWMESVPDWTRTASLAVPICRQIAERTSTPGQLWNVNFPSHRPGWPRGVQTVAMGVRRKRETIEKRTDPRGRPYYWTGLEPISGHAHDPGTDVQALLEGYVTISPLQFDLTDRSRLVELANHTWSLDESP